MATTDENVKKLERKCPLYQTVDGFRIPPMFSPEAFRTALAYKPRPDDLFIVTYPKCGTTWVQNIVASIYGNGRPFESGLEFLTQAPFLELSGAEAAKTMKRPGAIKIHLPFHLTPWSPEAKYIAVARNPKDCCVSFYHHTVRVAGYDFGDGSFDDFFEVFMEGETDFGDYFDTVMSWYDRRNDPNVLFLTYEELKKDTVSNVLKIAEFLGAQYKEALDKNEGFLLNVIKHSSFGFMKEHVNKYMAELKNLPPEMILDDPDLPLGLRHLFSHNQQKFQKNSSKVTFIRKGVVGDWKNYFSAEQNSRLEKKFSQKMGDTELAEIWKEVMGMQP